MNDSSEIRLKSRAGHTSSAISDNFIYLIALPGFFIGLQIFIHLMNGSDLLCVMLLGLTLGFAVLFANEGGITNVTSLISLIYIAKYVGISSLVKIYLGQPLDSNLNHPQEAFCMTFLSTVQLYLAFKLTSKCHFRFVFLREIADRHYYKTLFRVAYPLGTVMFLIGACIPSYASTAGEGFQTFMLPILIVAVVARTAYIVSDPSRSKELDRALLFMLGTSFLLAFVANLKFVAMILMLAYVVTIVVRKKSISLKLMSVGIVGVSFAAIVVFPLINLMRSANQSSFGGRSMKERTMSERIESMWVFFETQDLWAHLQAYEDTTRQDGTHYPYFGNTGSFGTLLERVSMVQHADIIKSGIDSNGELGIWPFGWAVMHAVPRVLNGEKNQDAMCDMMFAHAGVLPKGFKNDLTLGMVGGSYAMFGWTGVATIPFVLFTCFFLQQRLFAGPTTDNLWAIIWILDSFNAFTECDPSSFLEHLIREFPLHFAALYACQKLVLIVYRAFPARRQARP